ncbi:MAG: ABC transporter substrate-binding protein [Roseinatronobacter sp.]
MTKIKLMGAALLALALAAGSLQAQERTPNDPRLLVPGQLTVGTGDPVYPPWMLNNDPASGEGFENAMIYALAAEMGFAPEQVVWVGNTFEQTIAPGAKNFDFAINQVSVTEPRKEVVSFSQVYFQPDKAVIALPGSPVEGATTFAELKEARWGAVIGTTDLMYLENIIGVQDAAVYDDQIGVFQAMLAGQIDATLAALPTALFATAVQISDASITAILPADENDRGHGLLFQKDNPLVEWVDEALSAIIARGVVEDLKAQYLIANPDLPIITE